MKSFLRVTLAIALLCLLSMVVHRVRSSGPTNSPVPSATSASVAAPDPAPSTTEEGGQAALPLAPSDEASDLPPPHGDFPIHARFWPHEGPPGIQFASEALETAFGNGFVRISPVTVASWPGPYLEFRLEEVRAGDRVLARGGPVAPKRGTHAKEITYDRGEVLERYTVRDREIEQDFVIESLAEVADLTVRCRILTDLLAPKEGATASELAFRRNETEALTLSKAVVIDAAQRKLPLDLTYRDGQVSLTVPADWLARATFPITIDPLVQSSFVIDSGNAGRPDVAFNSNRNEWLVVWSEAVASNGSCVMGQRVSGTGTLIGPPLTIGSMTLKNFSPRVSYAPNVDRYLVVWQFLDANYVEAPTRIHARLLNGEGTPIGADVEVASEPAAQLPQVAYDGAQWYVCWYQLVTAPYSNFVRGRFVTSSGQLGTVVDPETSTIDKRYPRLAYGSGRYILFWPQVASGTTTWNMVARAMDASGTFTPGLQVVDTATSPYGGGSAAFDVGHVAAGRFLFVWPRPNGTLRGRAVNPSLGFLTGNFGIKSGFTTQAEPCCAATDGHWFVLYNAPSTTANIKLSVISLTGGVWPTASITNTGNANKSARAAWNPYTADFLVVYAAGTSLTEIRGQRYNQDYPITLPPPTNLTAVSGDRSVSLTWTGSPGAAGYKVFQTQTSGVYGTEIVTVTGTTFTAAGLTNGTNYFFKVRAVNGGSSSTDSNEAWGYPLPPPPPVPTNLTITPGVMSLTLNWTASPGATSYIIYRSTSATGPFELVGSSSIASFVDLLVKDGNTYFYHVTATAMESESAATGNISGTPLRPPPSRVLFVVTNPGALGAGDDAIRTRLLNLGYQVDLVLPTSATSASAQGRSLVLISSTVSPAEVSTTFATMAAPLITWEEGIYGVLGMTGTATTEHGILAGQTHVNVVAPAHPLAAGLVGPSPVVSTAGTFSWGKPPSSAVVATLAGDATRAVLFGYDTGAQMVGRNAPARRVGLFLQDLTAQGLTAQGAALFDAAVNWAVGAPLAPDAVNTFEDSNRVDVTWDAVDGAIAYNVWRSSSASGPFTMIAGGITASSFRDTAVANGFTYYYAAQAMAPSGALSVLSPATQATPAAGTLVVGVLGSSYLKAHRKLEVTYDTQIYRIVAGVNQGNGVIVPARNVTVTWLPPTKIAPGKNAAILLSPMGTSCTIQPSGEEEEINDISRWRITAVVNADGVKSKIYTFVVRVTYRQLLTLRFHFPEGVGQTQRLGADGLKNKFFLNDQPGVRNDARYEFAKATCSKVTDILRQAGIQAYPGFSDQILKWDKTYFDPDGSGITSVTRPDGSYYTSFKNLILENEKTSTLHVYWVKSVKTPDCPNMIACTLPAMGGTYPQTIIMGDPPGALDRGPSELAHEICHALRMAHVMNSRDAIGDVNRLWGVTSMDPLNETEGSALWASDRNPLNIYLMRPFHVNTYEDGYSKRISSDDSVYLFGVASTKHPARRERE